MFGELIFEEVVNVCSEGAECAFKFKDTNESTITNNTIIYIVTIFIILIPLIIIKNTVFL